MYQVKQVRFHMGVSVKGTVLTSADAKKHDLEIKMTDHGLILIKDGDQFIAVSPGNWYQAFLELKEKK